MSGNRRKFLKGLAATAILPPLAGISGRLPAHQGKDTRFHRVLCCNIRVALEDDEAQGVGWSSRKNVCLEIIEKQKPDIIALQEVLKVQADDLRHHFPAFQLLGFDGPEMDVRAVGYHGIAKNPIMFSKERYELVSAGCYWLSKTPLIAGSMSWGTARARHANWVRLEDKQTKQHFRVINLHLDHVSQAARESQTRVVLGESRQYPAEFPQLLVGDFNASMENRVYQLVEEFGWNDTYTAIHDSEEPGGTVHLFQGENYINKGKGRKIDYIFVNGGASPVRAEIIRDHVNGVYPSDHYFVLTEMQLL